MNTYGSAPSSARQSISDLDGYTLRDYNFPMNQAYAPAEEGDFGFDPPTMPTQKPQQMYTPPDLNGWPGFERDEEKNVMKQANGSSFEIDKLVSQTLPNATSAISRYGHITPPRTDSAVSSDELRLKKEESSSPKFAAPERKRRSKPSQKLQESTPLTSGRKRKSTRKLSGNVEGVEDPEDSKRKASLEKNRLAAAKCRINKKDKTEQLQRDSHDKAVHNAFLKDQVMRMQEEIQQMNAILLNHAGCEGCKSPEDIQKHLSSLGNDFLAQQQMMPRAQSYGQYPQVRMEDMNAGHMMHDEYFSSMSPEEGSTMLNPPLPEFNRTGDFEVHTPMHTD